MFANLNLFNVLFFIVYAAIIIALPIVEKKMNKDSQFWIFGIFFAIFGVMAGGFLSFGITPAFAVIGIIILISLLIALKFGTDKIAPMVLIIMIFLTPVIVCAPSEIGQAAIQDNLSEDRYVCVMEENLTPLDEDGNLLHMEEGGHYTFCTGTITHDTHEARIPVRQTDGATGVYETLEAYPETFLEKCFALTMVEHRVTVDPDHIMIVYE
jgi:hypothetical protein